MGDTEARSVEDREERIKQIDARLAELDAEYDNTPMTDAAREEWNQLNSERDGQATAVAELKRRKERMRQLAAQPGATESARFEAPSFVASHGDDIFDVQRLRTASRSEEDYRSRLHDNAKRAIEKASFPVAGGDKVRAHVEQLLARVDDRSGTLAKRMLATGSPVYERAFGKILTGASAAMTGEEQRALATGVGADGGYAVPYQLDPTVILTSDGTMSPLRQIARVEQIVSNEWRGITSSGITVSRSAEGAAATGNEFSVAQPTVKPTRVIADVRYSVEIEQDWSQLRSEIARLLADAKTTEEDTSFVTGDGTGNNPFGVVATLATSSDVPTAGLSAFGLADVDALESALPPRFRARASFLANRAIYQLFRNLLRAQAASAGDRWVSHTQDMPASIDGFSAYEASEMEDDDSAAARLMVLGDFSQFLIVDRLGMTVEVNPHVTDSNGRWTGQRALVAIWRNSSKVLVDNAFRALKGHAT